MRAAQPHIATHVSQNTIAGADKFSTHTAHAIGAPTAWRTTPHQTRLHDNMATYVLCVGCAWVANPCVPPGIWCFRLLFSNGNSASQARGWALDPAPQVLRPVPPA
jgi:hypothetical protein